MKTAPEQPDPQGAHDPSLLLAPSDAAAADALAEVGFDPARTPAEHRERAGRIARLLELLGRGGPVADAALADVTLARIVRIGEPVQANAVRAPAPPQLSLKDDEALEAWVMYAHDVDRVPSTLRPRARRHGALADLVTKAPLAEAAGAPLADRALARVQAEIDRQRDAMSIQGAIRRRGRGLRLADLMSVAAVLLIGAAVIWPVLGAMREEGRRAICRANLGTTAAAMASYAGSYRDSLPMTNASLGGGQWWDVGSRDGHANSANLFTLVRDGFTSLASLACPGNPQAPRGECDRSARDWQRLEEVSYSMQLVYGPQLRTWNAATPQPVLADRSPVVLQAIRNQPVDPLASTPNHQCRGQCILFTDGSVRWHVTPILGNGDNIWLPRAFENRLEEIGRQLPPGSLSGRELPDGADDTVLGP